jgi:hypothetical protein
MQPEAWEPDPRADLPLHVRPGEDILARLEEGLPGDQLSWADPFCEGPLQSWTTDKDRRRDRAVYLSIRYFLSYGELLDRLAAADYALEESQHYRETVLWFEHDLYDQAILAFLLPRLESLVSLGRLRLISIDQHPSVDRFIGLGQLDRNALAALYPERVPVTPAQVEAASAASRALRERTPELLNRIAAEPVGPLPFLRDAMRRYLAEYPSVENGLSQTEQWALEALAGGAATAAQAFQQVQLRESAPFQGDSMFYAVLRGLSTGSYPLIAREGEDAGAPLASLRDERFHALPLKLTRTAEMVLANREDWFRVHGAARRIGGVSLIGPVPAWRWDRHADQAVPGRSS